MSDPHQAPGIGPAVGLDALRAYFGDAFEQVRGFHDLLADAGVQRGLLGPREVGRLWDRHLLNSASVVQFLPEDGPVVDVGSGAGLPGIVIAAMRPRTEVVLIETMLRRTTWLEEVVSELGLPNVRVVRGRAEEMHGQVEAAAVTARAVAPLDRLAQWSVPLLRQGGALLALKGQRAAQEVEDAASVLTALGVGEEREVLVAPTIDGVEATTVVRMVRAHVRTTVQGTADARKGRRRRAR
ncbi:16S rRNA (guanine(527)-N(7))-methyltransferase RsmG [Cellulomonas bogoriensis]|uniref:Ribosomal RNA small subunit methyltransferase G n=1 Tax=Cellulomonas bogoriensis 69B4 = DSM 16987 TaxID=1386082 RepID=A0A0A0BZE2_9CELL|nr:16S rRNA (guanine(527)-N(7))-methyltransferase RsmG [Cellulomonas bogoriensis]KGM13281.1 16S rRNA methyltransferase [Cellulomonas bogoriensis 69B4 = DSM 16987]